MALSVIVYNASVFLFIQIVKPGAIIGVGGIVKIEDPGVVGVVGTVKIVEPGAVGKVGTVEIVNRGAINGVAA